MAASLPIRREAGFTLLELMIVVSILGIVASIGVPQYVSSLRIARVTKAKQELMTIAQAIDSFTVNNGGQLPLTLYQVGYGGRSDPWGMPYCYLNYTDKTGDGLQWAIDAGLVDPSAVNASEAAVAPSASTPRTRGGSFGDLFAWLSFAPTPDAQGALKTRARTVATTVAASVPRTVTSTEVASLADGLATAGSWTVYSGVNTDATRRRDRYMLPLNTDYDLFSLGPDARTAVSLGETVGLDDVIRANNGGFFGTASDY